MLVEVHPAPTLPSASGMISARASHSLRSKPFSYVFNFRCQPLLELGDRSSNWQQGGHVDTFVDENTGTKYDYGVQNFIDYGNAKEIFQRLGIQTAAPGRTATTTTYVDFTTGKELNFTAPDITAQMAALDKYRVLAEQWEDILLPGYFDFPEPANIPSDLLLPFGEFVTKHGIEAAVPFVYKTTGLGVGDVSTQLTIYVMQAFGAPMARSLLGLQDSIVPASGRNQDVYDAFADALGDDVLFSSTIIDSKRTDYGVFVVVKNNKTGDITLITARALLVAIEPTAGNTEPLDLDETESAVFSKFDYTRIYAGIVASSSLPVGFSLFNLPAAAEPDNLLAYPSRPFTARFDYLGADKFFRVMVIGDEDSTSCKAMELAQRDYRTLIAAGQAAPGDGNLGWVAFEDHGAMHLRVSADDLKAGFVQDQYALQGRRATWYTGAAFSVQFQTHLWGYNDILLPKLVASLES